MENYKQLLEGMRKTYTEHTGASPQDCTDIDIRLQVLAGELDSLYSKTYEIERQMFPQSSTGENLDLHGQLRGLSRKKKSLSSGELVFTRQSPANVNIIIPKGTIVATNTQTQLYFSTTSQGTLKEGETNVRVNATSTSGGTAVNIGANKINLIVSTAPGISGVTNPQPFTGGKAEESDEDYRARILKSYQGMGSGVTAGYYQDIVGANPLVEKVKVIPRRRGRGTVDVVITTGQPQVLAELKKEIDEKRLIAVDVGLEIATKQAANISLELMEKSGYNWNVIAEQCRGKIEEYFAEIEIGAPFRLSHLGYRLLEVKGLESYRFLKPAEDIAPLENYIVTLGELSLNTWGNSQ